MRCDQCGQSNEPEATTCLGCGQPLALACAACARTVPVGALYCPACGARVAAGSAGESEGIERAERRTATALFSDLSGYTALNETLDPEDVAAVMARIKEVASRIVESHGGTVNQFVGDQIMALFGVPLAHDDDPLRAVRAALALRDFVRELAGELAPRLGRRLALHTAVNSGLMVAERRDQREGVFGVTGDAINTGARLAQVAGPDEVVVGPATWRAIEPYCSAERIGEVQLRGRLAPVEAYRVLGVVARSKFEVARRRGLSALVGRSPELLAFRERLSDLARGKGCLLVVSGEPGVGKSRLFHEFARVAREASVAVLSARCEPFGHVAPYAPIAELLREQLGLEEGDAPEHAVAKSIERVAALGEELRPDVSLYLHVLSLRSPEHPLPAELRGEALRQATFRAIASMLELRSRTQPLVVLLEDWQWADQSSELCLRHLLRALAALPVLLAVNYRSEFAPDWTSERTELSLRPLDSEDARALIESRFEAGRLPQDWGREILERSGGNPFFIEELCRAVADSGELRTRRVEAHTAGGWVPDTVEAVVRARLDRLDPDAARVLRVASVLGSRFSRTILRELLADADLDARLAELAEADLVPEETSGGETLHRFKHSIIHKVAYETLLLRDRRELHDRAGRAIELHHAGPGLEAHLEELAHHFSRGSDREKALFYLESAGNKAAASFSLEPAREHFASAVRLISGLEETPERRLKRIDLTFRWAQAGWYGPSQEQIEALDGVRELARRVGDRGRELLGIYFRGWLLHTIGENAQAVGCFERCIDMADQADARLLSQLYCNLGENVAASGDYDRALEFLERGIQLRRGALPERWRTIGMAYALSHVALIHADRGDFESYDREIEEVMSIIRPQGQSSALSSINQVRTIAVALRGDWERCLEYATLGRQVANAIGAPPNHGMALALEGVARFMGRGEGEGIGVLREGLALMDAAGTKLASSYYLAYLAEALARSGDLAGAADSARSALDRGRDGDRFGASAAHRALALVCARTGDTSGAREALGAAARLAASKGSAREGALVDLVAAECLRAAGDEAAAVGAAGAAAAAFRSMGLGWFESRARELLAARGR